MVRRTVSGCNDGGGDTIIFNFGSNTHLLFQIIAELKRFSSKNTSIFLALSSWAPYPTRFGRHKIFENILFRQRYLVNIIKLP